MLPTFFNSVSQLPNESMVDQQQLGEGKTNLLDTPEEKKREPEAKVNVGERTLVRQITAREGRMT